MEHSTVQDIATDLMHLYEEACQVSFPYDDSRKLLRDKPERYEGFIPDLDFYLSTIAGYCSWGKRVLNWNEGKVEEVKARLGKSFFENYPQYKALEREITETNTPELYKRLSTHETMRLKLLSLLSDLSKH